MSSIDTAAKAIAPTLQPRDLSCGLATVCALPRAPLEPERYILPGGQIIGGRDQARFAVVALDALMKQLGASSTLLHRSRAA